MGETLMFTLSPWIRITYSTTKYFHFQKTYLLESLKGDLMLDFFLTLFGSLCRNDKMVRIFFPTPKPVDAQRPPFPGVWQNPGVNHVDPTLTLYLSVDHGVKSDVSFSWWACDRRHRCCVYRGHHL